MRFLLYKYIQKKMSAKVCGNHSLPLSKWLSPDRGFHANEMKKLIGLSFRAFLGSRPAVRRRGIFVGGGGGAVRR
jgi:hypothetical protein